MTVKELKTNNMGYTPYKMKGHELKGIKQRGVPFSGGVGSNEMESGVADSINASPNNFLGLAGIGSMFKKNKGGGGGLAGIIEKVKAKQLKKQQGSFQAGGGADLESRVSALEAGGGTDPVTDPVTAAVDGGVAPPVAVDAPKKKSMAEGWGGGDTGVV